jgi:outer membrane protein
VQGLGALRTALQQIVTQREAVVAAEEDLRVQDQRYRLGVSTVLDVLASQSQLNNARLALVQARFSARTAKAQLEALVGRDL